MEQATSIHPLCRLAIDPAGRTGGPTAIAHHAQRGHTRALFAETAKSFSVDVNGAARPTEGGLWAWHDRLGYTLTCLSICRALVGVTHGPIRQKDEIESGRHQWSEPIAFIRFGE